MGITTGKVATIVGHGRAIEIETDTCRAHAEVDGGPVAAGDRLTGELCTCGPNLVLNETQRAWVHIDVEAVADQSKPDSTTPDADGRSSDGVVAEQ